MSKQVEDKPDLVKTLKIGEKTHERLKKHGKFGDSFEDIINRLMDVVEGKTPKE